MMIKLVEAAILAIALKPLFSIANSLKRKPSAENRPVKGAEIRSAFTLSSKYRPIKNSGTEGEYREEE